MNHSRSPSTVPESGQIKSFGVQIPGLPFGQHKDGLYSVELLADVIPKVGRHKSGQVTPKTIDVQF
jgi:hypothetical protein